MANKRLGTVATELKLPTKKVKGEKKPKWQAKIVGKKTKDVEVVETPEVVVEATVQEELTLSPEPTETPDVATTPEGASVEPTTVDEAATTNEGTTLTESANTDEVAMVEPGIADESIPKKHRTLKVKADAPPKKLSMVAAALHVLQERKVAMTCPELIDVMATELLWVSPGGKTPANTLYMVVT